MENKEYKSDPEPEVEKWNEENSTGQSCGTCPNCGSKIYQSTYADYCMCGEQDFSY